VSSRDRHPQDDLSADPDPTRRTWLAAERTWLAWWRTALGASVAAIGIGGVLPEVVDERRSAYAVLGVAYAVLATAMFWVGAERHRRQADALRRGGHLSLGHRLVAGLSTAGMALAAATAVLVALTVA
jgi:putative membrane protein